MINVADAVDHLLEAPIAPSFTRIGYDLRRRLDHWGDPTPTPLAERVMVVTGATSGLGAATAGRLATAGATVVLVGRDAARTERAAEDVAARSGRAPVAPVIADLGELDAVRAAATELRDRFGRLDVLVHNAGALLADRRTTSAGNETTVATQVFGPFLLTSLLLPLLSSGPRPGRVLTMSSGGMYSAGLHVADLEMTAPTYRGTEQYARAKRAQVTLNELWAARVDRSAVVFHAVHPGWADTPGVAEALPTFRTILRPLLRTPDQGADTMIWLAADDGEPLATTGGFWLDRRRRAIHRLGSTRGSDTPARRQELWDLVVARTGAEGPPDRGPTAAP